MLYHGQPLDAAPLPCYTYPIQNHQEGVHCHEQKDLSLTFSASGVTAKVAENLADAIGADIFEIQPEVPYTKADLNWMDKKARTTIEMSDPTSRPAIAAKRDNIDEYDTIFVGFPIWWYVAPTIVNTFLESYNLKGKTIIPLPPPAAAAWVRPMKNLRRAALGQNCCTVRCSTPIPAKPTCLHG